ncbi:MAG: hypothetical protein RSD14_04920 [Clostridia bacterium]
MDELVLYENGAILVAQDVCKKIADFEREAIKIETTKKELKERLKQIMEEHNLSTFENEYLKVSYKKPSIRKTVDSKKLKEECPEVYDAYCKESNVSSSISLEVK